MNCLEDWAKSNALAVRMNEGVRRACATCCVRVGGGCERFKRDRAIALGGVATFTVKTLNPLVLSLLSLTLIIHSTVSSGFRKILQIDWWVSLTRSSTTWLRKWGNGQLAKSFPTLALLAFRDSFYTRGIFIVKCPSGLGITQVPRRLR